MSQPPPEKEEPASLDDSTSSTPAFLQKIHVRWAADPTPSADLVRAYRQSFEDDQIEASLTVVHHRGGQTEFDLGRNCILSADPLDRATGARILGQLGWGKDSFHNESVDLILPLLTETDETVLIAAAYALSHRKSPRGIPAIIPLIHHPNPEVRLAASQGLSSQDDPAAIAGLIILVQDADYDVRNWSAFHLGTLTDIDTPELREALAPLLDDPDAEIRGEALIGLAKRHDPRALPALIKELNGPFHGSWSLEAAELLADPQLLPFLINVRESFTPEDARAFAGNLDDAIAACTP